jgi:molybdate transport system ATP-binding protein
MVSEHLEVRFRHRLGTLELDVAFAAGAPWTVLFGPSGSGKSTILRAIAGLVRPDEGRIVIGGRVVFDSAAGVWVPAHERPMRWAAQKAMLYPWKTVKWHWPMGMSQSDEKFRGRGWVDEMDWVTEQFGLAAIANRRPEELSGGQRQLVGVVRAAAGLNGRMLLLDEPFTGMDAEVRDRLIEDLKGWIGEAPVLSVTHDVGEAFLLGAEVVRVAEGRVVGQGGVGEVLAGERERLIGVLRSEEKHIPAG